MSHLQAMRTLYGDYQALRDASPELKLPPLKLVCVHVEPGEPMPVGLSADSGAWQRACELARDHDQGRVRRRSGVWSSAYNTPDDLKDPGAGPPLWGEWASENGASVHLRPDGNQPGCFRFQTIREKSLKLDEEPDAGWDALLCQELVVIEEPHKSEPESRPPEKTPVLLYHVYWGGSVAERPNDAPELAADTCRQDDDPSAIGRLFTRFAGFAVRDVRLSKEAGAAQAADKGAPAAPQLEAVR